MFYKRNNVCQREVVVAFAVNQDGDLQPIQDASALGSVSSFLPLVEERSGAKFLIQADFLVPPGAGGHSVRACLESLACAGCCRSGKKGNPDLQPANPADGGHNSCHSSDFTSYTGQPAFDNLFGPELKVSDFCKYLQNAEVLATASGTHVRPELAVYPEAGLLGLLTDADLPLLFTGRTDLRLSDPAVDFGHCPPSCRGRIKRVELAQVARNKGLLKGRIAQPEWFEGLYRAMAETDRTFKNTPRRGRATAYSGTRTRSTFSRKATRFALLRKSTPGRFRPRSENSGKRSGS